MCGSRIPREAVRRLLHLRSDGRAAAVVAVYGNREYEDALQELTGIALEAGFVPAAGAVFIGEHSYHTDATPIAVGRPDADDLNKAMAFGQAIRRELDVSDRTQAAVLALRHGLVDPGDT